MDSFMKKMLIIFVVSFGLLQGVASLDENNTTVATTVTVTTTGKDTNSSTPILNATISPITTEKQIPIENYRDNNGLLQRSLYVAIGISSIVAIYFIVRAIKTRGRRKAKKYGVLRGTGEMELQPLDKGEEEEEDEDMTLFDRKNAKWQA